MESIPIVKQMSKATNGPDSSSTLHEGNSFFEKGAILFMFKPRFYIFNIVSWVVLVLLVLSLFRYLSTPVVERGELDMLPWLFVIYILLIFILYISYISIFEDMIIFEKGFFPPITSGSALSTILMRRTFIPFTAVEKLDMVKLPMSKSSEIIISALGRRWFISHKWNTEIITPIIHAGFHYKIIGLPT